MLLSSLHNRRFVGLALALVTAVTLSQAGLAQLQDGGKRQPDETIQIEAGEVFEILAESDDPSAETVWVLTQDRKFIEAARSKVFRTRQVQPGEYLLDGTTLEPMLGREVRRLFFLRIVPHTPKDPGSLTPEAGTLVTTSPRSTQNIVTLPENFHVLSFQPDQTDTMHFAVILDAAANQSAPDNMDTYAYSEASRLFVWFVSPRERMMEVAIQRKDGTIARSPLQLKIGEPENVISAQGILANARDDGSVRFALETPPRAGQHVVTLWDFGDGAQSLLLSPSHTYAKNGTYTVRVSVRDIMNGLVINDAQTTLTITGITEPTGSGTVVSSSSSSVSSASSSVAGTPTTGDGFFATLFARLNAPFARAVLIGVSIIVLLGLLVLVVMRLLRRSRLDETLESAESLLIKKNAVQAVIDAPAVPLQVKRSPKVEEEVLPEPEPTSEPVAEPPPAEPVIDVDAAPSWLKKGLEATETTSNETEPVPTQPEPTFEPAAPVAPERLVFEEAPTPMTEPVAEPEPEPVPTPEPVFVPEPAAEPVPEPIVEPVVVPEPEPVAAPVIEPEPEPEPVPQTPTSAAQPAAAPVQTTLDAKAEREREKRRLKRQRYRQNLKKREQENKVKDEVKPKGTTDIPVATEESPEPLNLNPNLSVPEPTPIIEPQPEPVIAPEPILALPPENFAEELPAAQASAELPAARPSSELPAPTAESALPAAPSLAEPPVAPTNSDEDVQFIIRADNIDPDDSEPVKGV